MSLLHSNPTIGSSAISLDMERRGYRNPESIEFLELDLDSREIRMSAF